MESAVVPQVDFQYQGVILPMVDPKTFAFPIMPPGINFDSITRQLPPSYQPPRLASGTLENDIAAHTNGDFKKICMELCAGAESDSTQIDKEQVKEDAEKLWKAGEGKVGTDDSFFILVFTSRSAAHMRAVAAEYPNCPKNNKHSSLLQAVKSETSGHYHAMLAALIKTPTEFYAHRIHKAIVGAGTDDRSLIYLLTSINQPLRKLVAEYYQKKYDNELLSDVKDDTSGSFMKLLTELLQRKKTHNH